MHGLIERHWIAVAGLGLLLGCDPGGMDETSGTETDGTTDPSGSGSSSGGVDTGDSSSDSGDAMGPWEDLSFGHGWMQTVGSDAGLWIEREDAVLPATCDGELAAAEGSAGLAWTTASDDPADSGGADGGPDDSPPGASELLDDAQLAPRPGLGVDPSPIYAVTVHGQIADAAAGAEYPRVIEAQDANIGDHLVWLDVCETAEQRGHCLSPTDAFPFDGCVGVPTELPGFIIGDTPIAEAAGTWSLALDGSYPCDTDMVADTHPADFPLGAQEVEIAAGELPEGVPVEVSADMLTWRSSYRAVVDCEDVPELGDVCTCTWDYREAIELERGSLVREGDMVHVDLKGFVGDEPYLLWGRFPIAG